MDQEEEALAYYALAGFRFKSHSSSGLSYTSLLLFLLALLCSLWRLWEGGSDVWVLADTLNLLCVGLGFVSTF